MYGLYSRTNTKTHTKFKIIEEISLFGCNSGYIPWLLNFNLNKTYKEPYKWMLNIRDELNKQKDHRNTCIIIDFKPKNKIEDYILLGELTHVWGYSDSGWTPLLFRIEMIFTDIEPNTVKKNVFQKKLSECSEVVYTYLYAKGSISSGNLIGTWNPPTVSSTNSTLLWPETMNYFNSEIKKIDSQIISF